MIDMCVWLPLYVIATILKPCEGSISLHFIPEEKSNYLEAFRERYNISRNMPKYYIHLMQVRNERMNEDNGNRICLY